MNLEKIGKFFLFGILAAVVLSSGCITGGIISAEENTKTIENILGSYAEAHNYTEWDFSAYAESALDIWNILKERGINTEIWIGNTEKTYSNITEISHAWVMAEVEPLVWLALETAGGYVVRKEDNPLYYRGYSFDTQEEFMEYLDLRNRYNAQAERKNRMQERASSCTQRLEEMRAEFNAKYGGKQVSDESIEEMKRLSEKLGECKTLNELVNEEDRVLLGIGTEIGVMLGI